MAVPQAPSDYDRRPVPPTLDWKQGSQRNLEITGVRTVVAQDGTETKQAYDLTGKTVTAEASIWIAEPKVTTTEDSSTGYRITLEKWAKPVPPVENVDLTVTVLNAGNGQFSVLVPSSLTEDLPTLRDLKKTAFVVVIDFDITVPHPNGNLPNPDIFIPSIRLRVAPNL